MKTSILLIMFISFSIFAQSDKSIRLHFMVKEEQLISHMLMKDITDPDLNLFKEEVKQAYPKGFEALKDLS